MPVIDPMDVNSSRSPRAIKRWSVTMRISLLLVGVCLGVIVLLVSLQRMLMYHPRKGPVPVALAGDLAPHLREVHVTASDGVKLHGWLCLHHSDPDALTERSSLRNPEQRLLVVMFAGNAGNRSTRLSQLEMFRDLGCDALLVDYRGYGENAGKPSEESLIQDAESIWRFATTELEIPPHRIVISGESLGGGVAVALASQVCQRGETPAALILRATFSSMVETASHHYPWLPVRMVLIDRYPSIDRIKHVTCPRLHYHGDQDEVVPWALGKKLFDAGPVTTNSGSHCQFLTIPGAGHNDVYKLGNEQIRLAISQLLNIASPQ